MPAPEPAEAVLPLGELYAPVAAELAEAQQILADELISDQSFISDLCGHVRQFHGKMLRPAVLLLAARASGALSPAHPTLAAVVELVHLATLVHDDVLDEADIRRRAATVNRLWGNHRAVLMGDFLYSHAYHLCSSLNSQFAARLIGQTAVTVCEGEMMQVAQRGNFALVEAEYLDIITRKTAVLVEACCHLGAHYAGADTAAVGALRRYGRSVGVAFQIVDDLLDLTGEESQVGKSLGRDLDEGELTLPLIHHLAQLDGHPRDAALRRLHEHDGRRRELPAELERTGSLAYARRVAAEHIAAARTALAALPSTAASESLAALAEFVLARRL